ncbi:hypothetical protein H5410_042751 [Solanum commersonii]|uniref:Uncharacterized protein n=1 Tax=Solanum commersonii TaxID=4109 RepID=A0A9J5XWJ9_SOLCO|nr:hypothetical protein H5410_042751 [Solanum commersonii]
MNRLVPVPPGKALTLLSIGASLKQMDFDVPRKSKHLRLAASISRISNSVHLVNLKLSSNWHLDMRDLNIQLRHVELDMCFFHPPPDFKGFAKTISRNLQDGGEAKERFSSLQAKATTAFQSLRSGLKSGVLNSWFQLKIGLGPESGLMLRCCSRVSIARARLGS